VPPELVPPELPELPELPDALLPLDADPLVEPDPDTDESFSFVVEPEEPLPDDDPELDAVSVPPEAGFEAQPAGDPNTANPDRRNRTSRFMASSPTHELAKANLPMESSPPRGHSFPCTVPKTSYPFVSERECPREGCVDRERFLDPFQSTHHQPSRRRTGRAGRSRCLECPEAEIAQTVTEALRGEEDSRANGIELCEHNCVDPEHPWEGRVIMGFDRA
jgi:hypothetical protein